MEMMCVRSSGSTILYMGNLLTELNFIHFIVVRLQILSHILNWILLFFFIRNIAIKLCWVVNFICVCVCILFCMFKFIKYLSKTKKNNVCKFACFFPLTIYVIWKTYIYCKIGVNKLFFKTWLFIYDLNAA